MARLEGKSAFISGGAGGLGSATAQRFIEEGAKVTLGDLDNEANRQVAKKLGADFVALDVTQEEQWQAGIAAAAKKNGGIDVLVNAAGIEGDIAAGDPEKVSFAEWRKVHAVNLDGTFLGCRTAFPVMQRKRKGSIVNISSIVSFFGTPRAAAYGSSKAGVEQFTRTMALHGVRDGLRVRCNSVHPGVIQTRMIDSILGEVARQMNASRQEAEAAVLSAIPYGEIGEPSDVANLILFLASDESKYVTGSAFQVDGGWHLVQA
jgi:NAD(P)-dependent dehydrogenase (short-subunit alcohol dehydrogenase family)